MQKRSKKIFLLIYAWFNRARRADSEYLLFIVFWPSFRSKMPKILKKPYKRSKTDHFPKTSKLISLHWLHLSTTTFFGFSSTNWVFLCEFKGSSSSFDIVIRTQKIDEDEKMPWWHPCLANLSSLLFQNFSSTFIHHSNRH